MTLPVAEDLAKQTESAESGPSAAYRRRRWLAVSLRSLMVLVLIVGAWLAWQVNRVRAVRRAIGLIERDGGDIYFDDGDAEPSTPRSWKWPPAWLRRLIGDEFFYDVVEVRIWKGGPWDAESSAPLRSFPRLQKLCTRTGLLVTDASIDTITSLSELREIVIFNSEISDRGLARLKTLHNLRVLCLSSERITGATIGELATLPDLRVLSICSWLTDEGVNSLAAFKTLDEVTIYHDQEKCRGRCRIPLSNWTNLQSLIIWNSRLAADDWENLKHLTNLHTLELWFCEIDDRDLVHLAELKQVRRLDIEESSVTAEGIAELQKLLPMTGIKGPAMPLPTK